MDDTPGSSGCPAPKEAARDMKQPKRPPPAQTALDGLALVPSSKRQHVVVDAAGVVPTQTAPTSPQGKRQLRPSMLVLFFVVQVKEELRHNRRLRRVIREENAISQKRTLEVFQKSLDNACQNLVNHINCSLQSLTQRTDILRYEVEQLKRSNSIHRYRPEANQENAAVIEEVNQGVELRFLSKLIDHIVYTKDKITAEDGTAIKIAIFRDNQIVTSGQLSSARIEILVLHEKFHNAASDNWTEREFDQNILKFQKGPVLGGVCQVKLKNGEASLTNVFFNIPSSKTGNEKLILAARAHSSDKAGLRIKEAVMNPVEVQVYRNKQNKKSDCPKLKDEVHRLRGISVKGCRIEWLKANQINTVEEFIKALNKDEEKIRTECFKLKKDSKDWKDTVKHAKECDLEGNCKLKSYRVEEHHVVLFFNCVHDLVGAKFRDYYVSKGNLNPYQQDAVNCLKIQAYDVLDGVPFDHEMKGDYPVSLTSAMNTSLGADASIPVPDTAGSNPPRFHVAYQGPSLQEQFPSGQYGLHGYQGNQADAVAQMGPEYPQDGIAHASEAPLGIPEGTSSGVNNIMQTDVQLDVSDDIYAELQGIVGYLKSQVPSINPYT